MAKKTTKQKEYPKCSSLLVCDALVIDPNSSKPNLFGVFDNFKTPKLPSKFRFSVFLKLYGGKGVFPLRIALVDPNGKEIEGASMDVEDFEASPKIVAKIGGTFGAVEISKKGNHKFVVRTGNHVIFESSPMAVEIVEN